MFPKLFDIVLILAVIMAGFFIFVRYLEKAGVFFPSRQMEATPAMIGLGFEDITFPTKDHVKINGWLIRNPHAGSTVIFAHGNAGNITNRLAKIKFIHDLGLNVLIFDYRGYGKSEGKPSEQGIYLDAQGAYDYLQERGDVKMDHMILYGESLGGAAVIDLATHRKASLLIVESSFSCAGDMSKIYYPFVPAWMMSLKFNSIDKVRHLQVPKLFIHSSQDDVVPYAIGRKLFEAACEPKEFLKISGGHNSGSITHDQQAEITVQRILRSRGLI